MDRSRRTIAVLGPGLAANREPGIGQAQPPRGAHRKRFTGSLGLIRQVPVPELRVIGTGVEENIGPIGFDGVGFRDRRGQPPAVGLARELGYPLPRALGSQTGGTPLTPRWDSVGDELSHERVKHN